MTSIFISYRREDASGHAGRVFDRLAAHYSEDGVFIDHHDLPPGQDFASTIESSLAKAAAVLVIIGPRWADARDAQGRPRLAQREDFVRREVLSALASEKLVIPVLVGGATMPSKAELPQELASLAGRQACLLRDSRFDDDFAELLAHLPPRDPAVPAPASTVAARLAGTWLSEVKYEWSGQVTERFEFEIDGDELFGSGTFLTGTHPLEEVLLLEDGARFVLHSEATTSAERRRITHRYRVRLEGDALHVRMQSTGGFNDGPPLKFTARRA